jgi:hypothetical protein
MCQIIGWSSLGGRGLECSQTWVLVEIRYLSTCIDASLFLFCSTERVDARKQRDVMGNGLKWCHWFKFHYFILPGNRRFKLTAKNCLLETDNVEMKEMDIFLIENVRFAYVFNWWPSCGFDRLESFSHTKSS